MSILDRERIRAALGARLADRFLQYADAADPEDRKRLLMRIDEHLASARHAAARWRPGDREAALALVDRLGVTCKRLLVRCADLDGEAGKAAVAAVRYFLDTHDLERDDEPSGFEDDAQVLEYVVGEVAPELAGG